MKKISLLAMLTLALYTQNIQAQQGDPKATEVWQPEPKLVTPGEKNSAPSDAIVLFDGSNLDEWQSVNDTAKPAMWTVKKGAFTVKKGTGNIQTKRVFTDYQLRERH